MSCQTRRARRSQRCSTWTHRRERSAWARACSTRCPTGLLRTGQAVSTYGCCPGSGSRRTSSRAQAWSRACSSCTGALAYEWTRGSPDGSLRRSFGRRALAGPRHRPEQGQGLPRPGVAELRRPKAGASSRRRRTRTPRPEPAPSQFLRPPCPRESPTAQDPRESHLPRRLRPWRSWHRRGRFRWGGRGASGRPASRAWTADSPEPRAALARRPRFANRKRPSQRCPLVPSVPRTGLPGRLGGRVGGRVGRTGWAPGIGLGGGGMESPTMGARAGKPPDASRARRTTSPVESSGRPAGWIWRLMGDALAASRRASQRSAGVLAVMEAPAALASLSTSDAGNRAVGSGGWAEKRNACRTRPSSRAWVICSSQWARSFLTRRSSSSRSLRSNSRAASSLGAADATVVRRSRSEIVSSWRDGRLGPVEPGGLLHRRGQLLRESEDGVSGDLGPAFRAGSLAFFGYRAADSWDTSRSEPFRNRTLLGSKACQQQVAVRGSRLEPRGGSAGAGSGLSALQPAVGRLSGPARPRAVPDGFRHRLSGADGARHRRRGGGRRGAPRLPRHGAAARDGAPHRPRGSAGDRSRRRASRRCVRVRTALRTAVAALGRRLSGLRAARVGPRAAPGRAPVAATGSTTAPRAVQKVTAIAATSLRDEDGGHARNRF